MASLTTQPAIPSTASALPDSRGRIGDPITWAAERHLYPDNLKVLHEAGLVEREKRGRWVYYRAVPDRLAVLSRALTD